ncbi:flagellar brake domain-containing protein [Alkalihalobacillus sp. LMS39]|uniref:flagellar brake protein n=1 Tax=Alkalihalobacillus sp. LMS39 TaxID=2924032 RepID=UPI001FB337B1|nr:flagellar brake domain-containing protein [Alkalihalobacillus sp. LMS39]UOE92361.1 flagellar brake domain-containing protein [Alkalihalobacillus sp. LMS39]
MIEIGATIHLQLKNSSGFEHEEYKCRLVDRKGDKLIIDHPIHIETNKPGLFYIGTEFYGWFVGKDKAVYSFETKLEERRAENIPIFILQDPGKDKYSRIQRRNYVRVDTGVDVAVHSPEGVFEPFTTLSLDLSGGGIAISVPPGKNLPDQGEVICWFVLHMKSGEIFYIRATCKIIRVFQKLDETRERASLEFSSIHERDRQRVVRYCFERQALLHRKGL